MNTPAPLPQLEAEIAALRQLLAAFRFDLAGKDWLTVEEAAYYCGVSISQFNTKAAGYSLAPRNFMGKKLYEKAALYRAIHEASQWGQVPLTGYASAPQSPGVAAAFAKLARYERRRGRT
ncbi:hypothetical protein [Stenotrophomonas rhizophila]